MAVTKNLQLIQALRGIASLLVVFLHATGNAQDILHIKFLFNFFKFGGAGVDIFFVLSGFIITYTSLNSIGSIKNLPGFLRRRFIRIFPIYWIIISILLISQLLLPFFYKTHYPFNIQNLLGTFFLLPDHIMVNGVSWTLSYEIFFYLLFSVAFFITSKKLSFLLAIVYAILLVLLQFINPALSAGKPFIELVIFPMNIEFVLGIIVAAIVFKFPKKLGIPFIIVGSLLFLLNGIITNNGLQLFDNVFNRVIFFGVPSFFIITGLVNYELHKKVFVPKFILNLGEASYSLYLLHLPVIVIAFRLLQKVNIKSGLLLNISVIVIIGIIIYASILFYYMVEKPIITKLNSLRKIKVATKFRSRKNK